MLEKKFILWVEVDTGLRPALLPPIIKLIMIDHPIFIVTGIKEVGVGITSANFLHIYISLTILYAPQEYS